MLACLTIDYTPEIKTPASAVDSFSNPEVLAVLAKLQKAEIRLCPFSEPSNSRGALAPPAPPQSGFSGPLQ